MIFSCRCRCYTKSSRMGVKKSSITPPSRHTQPCITPSCLSRVSPGPTSRKAVAAGDDVGDLRVRVAVHGTHTAGLKGIFHAHGILAVGQNAALYALAAHLRLDLGMGHPYYVFMLFFHYNTTSFPIQTQKAAASRQSLPGCRRAQSFGISSAITEAACRCKPECRHRRTGSGH